MVVWSIQPINVYENILKNGYYRCDGRKIDRFFRERYRWLCDEMTKRIGKPPKNTRYPVWAWHTRNWEHKKPDLRNTGYSYAGDKMVCMELEIPDDKIVLTDFDAWHFVLNKWYLNTECTCEEIWDADHKKLDTMTKEERNKAIELSWQGVFDVTPFENDWMHKGRWIQATFWEIRKENIKSVKFFTAR